MASSGCHVLWQTLCRARGGTQSQSRSSWRESVAGPCSSQGQRHLGLYFLVLPTNPTGLQLATPNCHFSRSTVGSVSLGGILCKRRACGEPGWDQTRQEGGAGRAAWVRLSQPAKNNRPQKPPLLPRAGRLQHLLEGLGGIRATPPTCVPLCSSGSPFTC